MQCMIITEAAVAPLVSNQAVVSHRVAFGAVYYAY